MSGLEAIASAARFAQFAAAMIILGMPFFLLRTFGGASASLPPSWARGWLWGATALLLAGAGASALAQTALMYGEPAAAFRPADVVSVLLETGTGRGLAARLALTLVLAALLALGRRDIPTWRGCVFVGALIGASFAWTGHGAASEGASGYVHLASDIVHTLAAAVWLGALVPLLLLVIRARRSAAGPADRQLAYESLEGFSGVGSIVVALLILSGAVNSWFLVGPDNIITLPNSLYGKLLLAKLALFSLMLALASANRFWLTPALARRLSGESNSPLQALRTSVLLETVVGLLILAVVSALGMLMPVSAL